MKKKARLRQFTVWLTLIAMLVSLAPVMVLPARAATISDSYTYSIKIKNSNIKRAGTDNTVSCCIEMVNGAYYEKSLDSGADDFERNDCRTYSFTLKHQPWEIKRVGLKHSGGYNAVAFDWFEFTLPNGITFHQEVNRWFYRESKTYLVWADTDREVKARGNFDSMFSGTRYFGGNSTSGHGDIVLNWNGKVSDQYFSDYTMSDYPGAVGITFSATGNTYGGNSSLSNIYALTDNGLAKIEQTDGLDTKITLYTNKLLSFMKNNRIFKLTLDSMLDYDHDYDAYSYHSETFTIYRTAFNLGSAYITTPAYTPEVRDNYFYNSQAEYKYFTVRIPVIAQDNYAASDIASSLAANINNGTTKAKIYYDTIASGGYITPLSVYSEGSQLILNCYAKEGYANPEGVGITPVLENTRASYNGQEYTLDNANLRYEYKITTHKVDTKGLTHTVKDADGEAIDPAKGFDSYANSHSFMLGVDSDSIYMDNGRGGRSEGYFSYRLFDAAGREVSLKPYNKLPTSLVPHTANSVYTVIPTVNAEGTYTLRIQSRDFANNLETTELPVKLDTLAPRASYSLTTKTLTDGSKRSEYTFTLTDGSGTGRLYYAFVRDGEEIPDADQVKPETSGPEDTLYEKWGFIDQANGEAATVVLALPEGDYFGGRLIWYTTDAAGNDSRTEKNGSADADGYYYADATLSNVKSDIELMVADAAPGLPSYDISFETSSLNTVRYRWKGEGLTTPFVTYTASSRPGSAWQVNGSGASVCLSGHYTLEYTVITPDGASETYTRDFLFDNTDPQIGITFTDSVITDSQGIRITAKDITAIEKLTWQLYSGEEAIGEPQELNAGLPVTNAEIHIPFESTGAYSILVSATDVNGQKTEQFSPVFSVRAGKPEIEVYHNVYDRLGELPLISHQDYTLTLTVTEPVVSAGDFDANQRIFYRTSTDGMNYSEWTPHFDMLRDSEEMWITFSLIAPELLVPGENRIYVQAAIASASADPASIDPNTVATSEPITILYDDKAPTWRLTMDELLPTNESVFGSLIVTDDYTPADQIELGTSNYRINLSDPVYTETGMRIDFEIIDNLEDDYISLTDAAGNQTLIPIVVDCIDTEPPEVYPDGGYNIYSGQREDYYLSLFIGKALEGETKFALIEGEFADPDYTPDPSDTSAPSAIPVLDPEKLDDSLFGPLPVNDSVKIVKTEIETKYENGESDIGYEIKVLAEDERLPEDPEPDYDEDPDAWYDWYEQWRELNYRHYVLAVRSEDALGNVIKAAASPAFTLQSAPAAVIGAACVPELAYTRTALIFETTVPVYVMPADLIPDEIEAMNLPDGRLDTLTDPTVTAFTEQVEAYARTFSDNASIVIDRIGDHAVYFADEMGRVFKRTVTVRNLDDREADEEAGLAGNFAYVSFGNELPVNVSFCRAEWDWDNGSWNDMSEWVEIDPDSLKAWDPYGDYGYFLILEAVGDNVTLSEDYMGYGDGQWDFHMDYDYSQMNENYDYTRLVYEMSGSTSNSRVLAYTATVEDGELTATLGDVFELTLVDTTVPEVDLNYSTTDYTNKDVIVTVNAYDSELASNADADDVNEEGSDPTAGDEVEMKEMTAEELAKMHGIANLAVSGILADYPDDPYSLTYTDLGAVSETSLTFTQDGYAVVKATNTLGLVSYVLVEVGNINREAITEGEDYNLTYYYTDENGYELPITDEGSYREVRAAIELTWEGEAYKDITSLTNLGSLEAVLTPENDSFTFVLEDCYGNRADVTASFDRWDTEGPAITWIPEVAGKTNEAYSIFVSVTDLLNAPGSLTVTDPFGRELEITSDGSSTDPETGLITGEFAFEAADGGRYTLIAADILGNESMTRITVDNIDTTVPRVTRKVATSVEPTLQMVGVKLTYSEPNVRLTKVEPVEGTGLEASDILVDWANSTVRFDENGSLGVWFTDEYGNVGSDVISVSNINRTAPSLKAVTTLADDELSVTVTFEKNPEERRELSELYVLHNGITPVESERDEEGNILSERVLNASEVSFRIYDNGTYFFTVYDGIGNVQKIPVEVTGIDRTAPVITEVAWSYTWTDADGEQQEASYKLIPGDEIGYNIVEDDTYKGTNQDITATVTTDSGTKFVGSPSSEYSTTHSVVYGEDGWFNFNLEKPNGLMDQYGLGLYVIDKQAPVIEDDGDLMFFENTKAGTPYDRALLDVKAYDERYDEITDLSDQVEIDWGGFNPDDIRANTFDKNKPYTITYTVRDAVGNETTVRRTVTLVGLFDTMLRVNGFYPDSTGRAEAHGGSVELTLDNFGGRAWARYDEGIHTMGEMKNRGEVIEPSGTSFRLDNLAEGWYTFYVQTDLCDYFCVNVYVWAE